MTQSIEILKQPRLTILDTIKELSIEQLNDIPTGFNNNIAWNLGHMVAAQQGICYTRAGLNKVIDDTFFNTYKPGTKPENFYDAAELENIKTLMFSTLDQLAIDLQTDMFANYQTFTTRYNVEIANIDGAMKFLPFHEGLHMGYIMALRRLVK
jgi:hypothetical protein